MRLPEQRVNMSPGLQKLLNQAETECKKKIRFSGITREGFIGRTEWGDNEVLVEVKQTLNATIAEYIAAHELGHVLQLSRRCAIASGRLDEPGAVTIATMITDFVLDPLADSIAIGFGIPMATGFQTWLESESLLDVLKRPRDGQRYGTNWKKVWETLTEVRVCRALGLKVPKPPKDFWTLYIALDLGKIQQLLTMPKGYLEMALRRFSKCYKYIQHSEYAGTSELDDYWIDLVIALESITSGGHGGISRNMQRRTAFLLGQSGADQEKIKNRVREIYKQRCSIVHGEEKDEIADATHEKRFLEAEVLRSLTRDTINACIELLIDASTFLLEPSGHRKTLAQMIDERIQSTN